MLVYGQLLTSIGSLIEAGIYLTGLFIRVTLQKNFWICYHAATRTGQTIPLLPNVGRVLIGCFLCGYVV